MAFEYVEVLLLPQLTDGLLIMYFFNTVIYNIIPNLQGQLLALCYSLIRFSGLYCWPCK